MTNQIKPSSVSFGEPRSLARFKLKNPLKVEKNAYFMRQYKLKSQAISNTGAGIAQWLERRTRD